MAVVAPASDVRKLVQPSTGERDLAGRAANADFWRLVQHAGRSCRVATVAAATISGILLQPGDCGRGVADLARTADIWAQF